MLKPYVPTSPEIVKAAFEAVLPLEKKRLFQENVKKDDDISFNRARNELYSILDSNGYVVEWNDQTAHLKKGSSIILTRKVS